MGSQGGHVPPLCSVSRSFLSVSALYANDHVGPIYPVSVSATDKSCQFIPALLTEPHLQYTGTIKFIFSSFAIRSTVGLSLINQI